MDLSERGRTLTETLTMLAIMGILSVVGVWMYDSAMDKNKANDLIEEAQKRAVIVAGQIGFNGQTPSLAEFSPYNTTSSGTFGEVITKGLSGQFGIQVSNVNKSICQNILNTIGDKTPIRRLSYETTPTTPITTCKEDDDFLFIYNNDMTGDDKVEPPTTCRTVNDCKSVCATCEIPEDEEVGICINECEDPVRLCQTDNDCKVDNECNVCNTESGLCKNGCERVEYLESKGTQWIDTGLYATDEYGYHIINTYTKAGGEQCAIGSMDSGNRFVGVYTGGGIQISGGWGSFVGYIGEHTWDENTVWDVYCNYKNDRKIIFNGTEYKDLTDIHISGTLSNTIYLGARHFGSNITRMKGKIYSAKITEGTEVIADFIPVIAPDGRACMFNKVKEDGKLKLYCDANGGTFKTNKD